MAKAKRDWKSDPIDIDYLIDSGLLFKVNQTVFHLFGIALSVKVDKEGTKSWSFIDAREEPEDLTFDERVFETGELKYQNFRRDFGGNQINRRQQHLGSGCQNYPRVARRPS